MNYYGVWMNTDAQVFFGTLVRENIQTVRDDLLETGGQPDEHDELYIFEASTGRAVEYYDRDTEEFLVVL